MKDKPTPFAELFGTALQNLGDAIIQSIDEALLASRGPAQLDIPPDDDDARGFAAAQGVEFVPGRALVRAPDQHNLARAYGELAGQACVDFGRCVERIPAFVLTPPHRDALVACIDYVRRRGLELRVRGSGLSCGGQTLTSGGAILDLRRLDGLALGPGEPGEPRSIRVGGGVTWQRLLEVLGPLGLRPLVVPLHEGATVGGTLAGSGGFGESSHARGRAAQHVEALELLTPDGTLHELRPGDALFDHALGSGGRLGVIVSATLPTLARPSLVTGVSAGWESVAQFVDDAISVLEDEPQLDVLLARRAYDAEFPVLGTIGRLQREARLPLEGLRDLNAELGPVEQRDVHELAAERWSWLPGDLCAPALELTLPLPAGVRTLRRIEALLDEARLLAAMPRGAWLFVMRGEREAPLPLLPLPRSEHVLHVELRPLVRQHRVRNVLRVLEAVADEVLESGGTLQRTGSEPLFDPNRPHGALDQADAARSLAALLAQHGGPSAR